MKTEVITLKSFVLEQFLLTKHNIKPDCMKSQCGGCSASEYLIKFLLDHDEFLRHPKNDISNLLNTDTKSYIYNQNSSYKSFSNKIVHKSGDTT